MSHEPCILAGNSSCCCWVLHPTHPTATPAIACIPTLAVARMCLQVLLLSGGLMLYQGPTAGLQPWFSAQLGYRHQAALQGSVSDWALDLVAVGFDKPKVSCWRGL